MTSISAFPQVADLAVSTHGGHVITLILQDIDSGEILQIVPGTQPNLGIYLKDLEIGYPEPRETVSSYPDRDGTLDITRYSGARAVTLSALTGPASDVIGVLPVSATPDANGLYSGATWAAYLASWAALGGRRVRMVYRMRGQMARALYLRPTQLAMPVIGSSTDRVYQQVQVSWKCPDGMVYELPDRADATMSDVDQTVVGIPLGGTPGVGGLVFTPEFSLTPPINFAGASGTPSTAIVSYRGDAPSWPTIKVYGPVDSPIFSIADASGNVRATMTLHGLIINAGERLEVDMRARTVLKYASDTTVDVRNYLSAPAPWRGWYLKPDRVVLEAQNVVNFSFDSATGYAELAYKTVVMV